MGYGSRNDSDMMERLISTPAELLEVERITDVTWNKTAFKQLVAPDETKELIQAVVSGHGVRVGAAPDIIEGKGQGLLILLHGAPGTGKTLTAESIAEEQERPLYRATCGDIGIEPREVEVVCLESRHVMMEPLLINSYIVPKSGSRNRQGLGMRLATCVIAICARRGKLILNLVVLLDEADVFLEERTYNDQRRNATISSEFHACLPPLTAKTFSSKEFQYFSASWNTMTASSFSRPTAWAVLTRPSSHASNSHSATRA